ncbi:MAG TPA: hypothetical protein PKK10_01315 [Woeseiaceae bacterium]|nr:hypothetical protein [Woeseiaceae bacterium]
MNQVRQHSHGAATGILLLLGCALVLPACVTSRIENSREGLTGIGANESVVIMAKSYHLGNETEEKYIGCIEKELAQGKGGLHVIPHRQFVDSLFPWFEPRTAPSETKGLPKLMERPGVAEQIRDQRVRYIIWLDGDTDKVAGGGSLSCAAGPGGGGCFGFAWWKKDADYNASVWDLDGLESAGSVTADVSGTSFMPALVIPIPLIARTQAAACKGLAKQLRAFIVSEDAA